jgi:FkbM family methyltransferase
MFHNWWKTIFPLNSFFDRPTILILRNGSRIWVRSVFSSDLTVVEGVLFLNEYRLDQLGLPENAVIYDLGANIGTFSVAARRVCPSARIVAYEPAEENLAILIRNAPFAELHQEAIAGHTGEAQFYLSAYPYDHRIVKSGGIKVRTLSLQDAIMDKRVDLLKLDIEGAEYDALEQADPSLFKHIDRIVMETHALGDWGEKKLSSLGYKTQWFWVGDGSPDANKIIYGERI